MSNSIECILDSSSWQQAQAIADGLLAKGLAVSVEFMEVKAEQWRRQADENVRTIKLIITTTSRQQAAVRRFAATVKNESKRVLELPDIHLQVSLNQWLGTVVAGRLLRAS
jgi:uncharacterized protein involved in tolerance to divalent cations